MTATNTPAAERVLRRVDSSKPDACWLWPGATTPDGKYGVVGIERGRNRLTHVVIHEAATGTPVPEGWQVDHLCLTTLCCNPRHLEAVTQPENLRRQHELNTHCVRGHELTPENTYHPRTAPTNRQCRACNHLRSRARTDPAARAELDSLRLQPDPGRLKRSNRHLLKERVAS